MKTSIIWISYIQRHLGFKFNLCKYKVIWKKDSFKDVKEWPIFSFLPQPHLSSQVLLRKYTTWAEFWKENKIFFKHPPTCVHTHTNRNDHEARKRCRFGRWKVENPRAVATVQSEIKAQVPAGRKVLWTLVASCPRASGHPGKQRSSPAQTLMCGGQILNVNSLSCKHHLPTAVWCFCQSGVQKLTQSVEAKSLPG